MQDWRDANASQTSVPFEREYMLSDEPTVSILKQNIGMFTLRSGAEVHIQSFGIFNLSLWDDVMAQFQPLTDDDVIYIGDHHAQAYPYGPLPSHTVSKRLQLSSRLADLLKGCSCHLYCSNACPYLPLTLPTLSKLLLSPADWQTFLTRCSCPNCDACSLVHKMAQGH